MGQLTTDVLDTAHVPPMEYGLNYAPRRAFCCVAPARTSMAAPMRRFSATLTVLPVPIKCPFWSQTIFAENGSQPSCHSWMSYRSDFRSPAHNCTASTLWSLLVLFNLSRQLITMSSYSRDLIGYGRKPPQPNWPNGARSRFIRRQLRGGRRKLRIAWRCWLRGISFRNCRR